MAIYDLSMPAGKGTFKTRRVDRKLLKKRKKLEDMDTFIYRALRDYDEKNDVVSMKKLLDRYHQLSFDFDEAICNSVYHTEQLDGIYFIKKFFYWEKEIANRWKRYLAAYVEYHEKLATRTGNEYFSFMSLIDHDHRSVLYDDIKTASEILNSAYATVKGIEADFSEPSSCMESIDKLTKVTSEIRSLSQDKIMHVTIAAIDECKNTDINNPQNPEYADNRMHSINLYINYYTLMKNYNIFYISAFDKILNILSYIPPYDPHSKNSKRNPK